MSETIRINRAAFLKELQRRARKCTVGLSYLFEQAGVPLKKDGTVTLDDLRNLQRLSPDKFAEAVDFMYPEKRAVANASDDESDDEEEIGVEKPRFNWQGLVGGVLSGAGSFFTSMGNQTTSNSQAALNEQLAQREWERQQEDKKKNMILYGGLGLAAIIVVGIVLAKRK